MNIEHYYYYLDLQGELFSPKELEEKTEFILHRKIERDEPANYRSSTDPRKGQPSKWGAAILQAPEDVEAPRTWVLNTLHEYCGTFRKLKAEEITFWELVYKLPDAQKNFELGIDELKILGNKEVPYCLSIYDLEQDDLKILEKRYWKKRNLNDS